MGDDKKERERERKERVRKRFAAMTRSFCRFLRH
jgi:hypothetical protein